MLVSLRVTVTVDALSVNVFAPAPVIIKFIAVTEKLLALVVKVPALNCSVPELAIVNALPKVTVPAGALMVKSPTVFPPVMIVPVAVMDKVPE